jgi:hypothetical protein
MGQKLPLAYNSNLAAEQGGGGTPYGETMLMEALSIAVINIFP